MAFNCVIVTPEQQVLDQQVQQVIFPAYDGKIGILTDRAPLLAKIGVGALRLDLPGGAGQKVFFVDGGIAQMKDNKLTVLTQEATPVEDLNAEDARAALAEATARKVVDEKSFQERQHQLDRARAIQELAGQR